MTVEHSEQAKAAYPDVPGVITSLAPTMTGRLRTAFDRGMAERRITDRETLARTIWESDDRNESPWRDAREITMLAEYAYRIADAILALPSTPPASDKLKEFYRDAAIRIAGEVVDLEDKIAAVLDTYEKFWEYSPEDGWRFYRDMSALIGKEMPDD